METGSDVGTGRSEAIPGLVSIVVCAYNNWPDVEMTIESALHQSYEPLEVIVVDNSSTDATPHEVPRRFVPRIRYIRQPNRDCAGAYNGGFAVSRGEFIQFIDGDDVLSPNKIEKQVAIFRARPELDIVYGEVRRFQTLPATADWTDSPTQPEDDILMAILDPRGDGAGLEALGCLFRRTALERVGPWDENLYGEDTDYWLRAAWAGCRFGHCPGSPMGFARRRPDQKSANAAAIRRSLETIWEKAMGYVTREPYRGLIAARLAQLRFYRAIIKEEMGTREALAKLSLARSTDPTTISALAYAVAWMVITLPGGDALVRSRKLRPVRRILARLFRYPIPALDSHARNRHGRGQV